MDRALALARKARGSTRPNPPVGAVLVKQGRVVGEGHTQPAGGPHAEIMALAAAGDQAAGAELYVTLEPCSHWGRTPPCADALIAASVGRVHIALLDPNPLVNGTGAARLRDHGIPVEIGEKADEAADLIEAHATLVRLRRAFLTLALAVPDSCLAEIGRDADALLTDRAVPSGWQNAAYRLGTGRMPIHVRLVQSGKSSLATSAGSGTLHGLLSVLGIRVSSLLATGSDDLSQALLAEGLVDKLVAGESAVVPRGFLPRAGDSATTIYRIYYPEAAG